MQLLVAVLGLVGVTGLLEAEMTAVMKGDVPIRSESFTTAAGKPVGRAMGAILIERPAEDVWATVSRYDDKAEYVPRLEKVDVLEKSPGHQRVHMVINASVATARYTLLLSLDEKEHVIHWTLDGTATDNTVADVDGEYRLYEVAPSRTILVYRTYADPGRAVPKFIQTYLMRNSVPTMLRAIKKRIESGGTWKK